VDRFFSYCLWCVIAIALVLGGCSTWNSRKTRAIIAYNQANSFKDAAMLMDAEASYRQALTYNPNMRAASYNLALILVELGSYEEALARLKDLQSERPDNLSVLRALAWASRRSGNEEESLDYYTEALALFPADVESLKGYSELLESLNRPSEAIKTRRFVVELEDSVSSLNSLAATLLMAGHYQESLSLYRRALIREVDNQNALKGAYEASLALKQYRHAVDYLLRRVAVGGSDEGIWWNIARLKFIELGEYPGGFSALKRALEEGFSDSKAIDELLENAEPTLRAAIRTAIAEFNGQEAP